MSYVDGFVMAVPTANKAAFIEHARTGDPVFLKYGALRVVDLIDVTKPTRAKRA